VLRPHIAETTALGAAYLAGLVTGFRRDQAELVDQWAVNRIFGPQMEEARRAQLYAGWQKGVSHARDWEIDS